MTDGPTSGYAAHWQPLADDSGLTAVQLDSPAAVSAQFVPSAGMVGCSLCHRGEQVLGLRGGLPGYLASAKTFGVPLLAPWANRLSGDGYSVAGKAVDVAGVPGVHRDGNGLPIHGLLAAAAGWRVEELAATDTEARCVATLRFDQQRPEFPAFPFPHDLTVAVELSESTLTVRTSVVAVTDQSVPVAFGWHPYFTLPGVPRSDWHFHHPFTTHVELSDLLLPTGATTPVSVADGPLAERAFDDLYADVADGTTAWIAGGGRRVSMSYLQGYPYAIVYAPPDQELIALEPMTAPTGPFDGHFPVRLVEPGESFNAVFAIGLTDL
jgi:galactose mutarotase-like enzyme